MKSEELLYLDEFPAAAALRPLLRKTLRARWTTLCESLAECGVRPRVYGSHGWQWLTGLDHLHPGSDIDLWLGVDDAEQADAVVARLLACATVMDRPRLDGELLFPDGAAVAWREWAAWRTGRQAAILVKRLHEARLERGTFWMAGTGSTESHAMAGWGPLSGSPGSIVQPAPAGSQGPHAWPAESVGGAWTRPGAAPSPVIPAMAIGACR